MSTNIGQNWWNDLHSIDGIPKQIQIPRLWYAGVKCQYFCYILCKFYQDWSTHPRDYAGCYCNFWDEMAKIGISYQISQQVLDWTYQIFSIARHIYGDYRNDISFAVAEGTLLWWPIIFWVFADVEIDCLHSALAFRNKMQYRFVDLHQYHII